MTISENVERLRASIPEQVSLVAVTKTHPVERLLELYATGQRIFGENKVQEMLQKHKALPPDIQWHLIGHLQSNKVKEIASFVSLIHSVDSLKLLAEINKQGQKNNRVIPCLLQLHIAQEETKFGLDFSEVEDLLSTDTFKSLQFIRVNGLMGMATNTDDKDQIRTEFKSLRTFFLQLQTKYPASHNWMPQTLSMGMSSDYEIAVEEGSTLVRIGSAIFGSR
jgi:pyridoxal phosphate enzyme (YggS family)